jgi:hypothetical protein
MMDELFWVLIFVLGIVCIVGMRHYKLVTPRALRAQSAGAPAAVPLVQGTCGKNPSSCTAKDDVNNPAYNMKNVIKQTILLEEHLAEDNKYCKPCIVKHYLHIQALIEEAVWMACDHKTSYPMMEDSIGFYETSFQEWLAGKDDKNVVVRVLTRLRAHRQALIEAYFLSA